MQNDLVVVKQQSGQPHRGKVFAAVHAHLSDVPYYAAGLCAKLIDEGYTGYLIRTTNDEKSGGHSLAENIRSNEEEHGKMAAALGFKEVYDLYYENHRMDDISSIELRGRLIFLFRALKIDTVLSFHPSAAGEEDPDHWMTGRAAGEACWTCGSAADFHEHMEAGFQPHAVSEQYCFYVRPGQPFNRVVDVSHYIEKKIDAIVECKSQGGGNRGSLLRARLHAEGKRLALLGADDRTADREYVRQFLLDPYREHGKPHNLAYAERFYYIDRRERTDPRVDEFVARNAERL